MPTLIETKHILTHDEEDHIKITANITRRFSYLSLVDSKSNSDTMGEASSALLFLTRTDFFTIRILLPVICSFGIIGNSLSLVVIRRPGMRAGASTVQLLSALAASDLSICVLCVPEFIERWIPESAPIAARIFFAYYKIAWFGLSNTLLTISCWITVAVTAERFLVTRLCLPPNKRLTPKRTQATLIVICIAAIIFHFPKYFDNTVSVTNMGQSADSHIRYDSGGLTAEEVEAEGGPVEIHVFIKRTLLGLHREYQAAYLGANISLTVIIPELVLIILNLLLICNLTRPMSHGTLIRRLSKKRREATRQVTLFVVVMVTVFIVCYTLSVILVVNIVLHGIERIYRSYFYQSLMRISNFLVTFNSSVNFVLYFTVSSRFRATFAELFCKVKKASPDGILRHSSSFSSVYSTTLGNKV